MVSVGSGTQYTTVVAPMVQVLASCPGCSVPLGEDVGISVVVVLGVKVEYTVVFKRREHELAGGTVSMKGAIDIRTTSPEPEPEPELLGGAPLTTTAVARATNPAKICMTDCLKR